MVNFLVLRLAISSNLINMYKLCDKNVNKKTSSFSRLNAYNKNQLSNVFDKKIEAGQVNSARVECASS